MADMTPEDYAAKWQELSGKDLPANQKDRYKHIFGGGSLFQNMASWIPSIGFLVDYIFNTVDSNYVEQLDIMQNQQREITELRDAYKQMILQGEALMFTTPSTYYPSEGIVSIDLILIGGGGGGGGGKWNAIPGNRQGGSGGGGGGEITATIPANLLPASVPIVINEQGIGGGSESAGSVGGNVLFGNYLIAGGGHGGQGGDGNYHSASDGGSGLIPGGQGGIGGYAPDPSGGWSNYPGELRGGGGGGAAGSNYGTGVGGTGGASPGGLRGQPGTSPNEIIATGGGGGGAGWDSSVNGGAGGYPGGGGGGGWGGGTPGAIGRGGNGARGKLIVLERKF